MKHLALLLGIQLLLGAAASPVFAHCEIPCGIYDDALRMKQIQEHVTTLEKSMLEIRKLEQKPDKHANQITRWINNKEKHANDLQHIVTQYFMTQRVKLPGSPGALAREAYNQQLNLLHGMLVTAMQAKQTTDLRHITKLRELILAFEKSYFKK